MVEPYLDKCIRSICDQEMPVEEYEVIVVNDGSPDNSEALVRKIQQEISNIVLINQENSGVSMARNRGIEKASGEYLVFIDPDDFVNPNLLKRLYDRAKKDDLDILLSGRSTIRKNGKTIHQVGYGNRENYIFEGVQGFYEKDRPYPVYDSSVGRLYKTSFIKQNQLKFPEGVVHLEDGVFVRKVFTLAERVGFENCDFYQVYERPGSASRSEVGVSQKAVMGDIVSAKDLIRFKNSTSLNSGQLGIINSSIIKYSLLPLMRGVGAKNLKALIKNNQLIVKEGLKPLETEFVKDELYLNLAKAYNKSLWIFVISYLNELNIRRLKAKTN